MEESVSRRIPIAKPKPDSKPDDPEWFASLFRSGKVQNWVMESKQRSWSIERLHCDSYDQFVPKLQGIVLENGFIAPTWNKEPHRQRCVIEFSDPKLGSPVLLSPDGSAHECLPSECRLRGAFYSAPLRATVTMQKYNIETVKKGDPDYKSPEEREAEASTPADEAGPGPTPYKQTAQNRYVKVGAKQELREALLGMIPVCVGSSYCNLNLKQTRKGECPYDMGGVLIVRGFEKVVQPQKTLLPGRAIITTERSRVQRSVMFEAEIRSPHPTRARNTATVLINITREPCIICAKIPFLGHNRRMTPIPIVVLFKLLGFAKPEEIRSLVFPMFDPHQPGTDCTLEDCMEFQDNEPTARAMLQARATFETMFLHPQFSQSYPELYEWLASESDNTKEDRRRAVHNQIKAECLPQFGSDFGLATRTKKGLFIGSVVLRLLLMRANPELFPPDHKDDDGNKYLQLMHQVFSIMIR